MLKQKTSKKTGLNHVILHFITAAVQTVSSEFAVNMDSLQQEVLSSRPKPQ